MLFRSTSETVAKQLKRTAISITNGVCSSVENEMLENKINLNDPACPPGFQINCFPDQDQERVKPGFIFLAEFVFALLILMLV